MLFIIGTRLRRNVIGHLEERLNAFIKTVRRIYCERLEREVATRLRRSSDEPRNGNASDDAQLADPAGATMSRMLGIPEDAVEIECVDSKEKLDRNAQDDECE